MKKILFALLFSSPCLAGTITTSGTLMQITYSSATPVAGLSPKTFVQGSTTTITGGGCTATTDAKTITAGDMLVLGCKVANGNSSNTVSDTQSNSWLSAVSTTGNPGIDIHYVKSATAGSTIVTANGVGCNGSFSCVLLEYSGQNQSSPFDVAISSVPTATGLPITTTAATVASANELMVSFYVDVAGSGGFSGQSGTARTTTTGSGIIVYSQDANVPAGSYTSTWTEGSPFAWSAAQAAFK